MKSALQRLCDWYLLQCDGDWEHGYGFDITTLDNPGVALKIELHDTYLEAAPYEETKDEYESEDRWMICRLRDGKFEACGVPTRLDDMIEEFLRWAELHRK